MTRTAMIAVVGIFITVLLLLGYAVRVQQNSHLTPVNDRPPLTPVGPHADKGTYSQPAEKQPPPPRSPAGGNRPTADRTPAQTTATATAPSSPTGAPTLSSTAAATSSSAAAATRPPAAAVTRSPTAAATLASAAAATRSPTAAASLLPAAASSPQPTASVAAPRAEKPFLPTTSAQPSQTALTQQIRTSIDSVLEAYNREVRKRFADTGQGFTVGRGEVSLVRIQEGGSLARVTIAFPDLPILPYADRLLFLSLFKALMKESSEIRVAELRVETGTSTNAGHAPGTGVIRMRRSDWDAANDLSPLEFWDVVGKSNVDGWWTSLARKTPNDRP